MGICMCSTELLSSTGHFPPVPRSGNQVLPWPYAGGPWGARNGAQILVCEARFQMRQWLSTRVLTGTGRLPLWHPKSRSSSSFHTTILRYLSSSLAFSFSLSEDNCRLTQFVLDQTLLSYCWDV